MKCDELKDRWFWAYPTESVDCDGITGSAHEVYGKSEAQEQVWKNVARKCRAKAEDYK